MIAGLRKAELSASSARDPGQAGLKSGRLGTQVKTDFRRAGGCERTLPTVRARAEVHISFRVLRRAHGKGRDLRRRNIGWERRRGREGPEGAGGDR